MRYEQPLKHILHANRHLWDHSGTRPSVRQNFQKVIACKTSALGGEMYASQSEQKTVFHTCKARTCPSCGFRATLAWQREQWASLPNIPYAGIVLTMPDVLWPIFQANRHLLRDLPALGAATVQRWAKVKYGARVLIMVVPHTFGRRLNFNAHLHILVSAIGLHDSENRLVSQLSFDKESLMHIWRYAVITYLREAIKAGMLTHDLPRAQLRAVLQSQYERWWNIYVSRLHSKWHFLRYAGRYVRRPAIAQRRFTEITAEEIEFRTKDLKQKQEVKTHYSVAEFIGRLSDHVLDHYQHSIRYFGLLAPRAKNCTSASLFLLLKQEQSPCPRRLSWRASLRKYFGVDPLLDSTGQSMHWVGRFGTKNKTSKEWIKGLSGPRAG
jgi:hypothetical protein